MGFHEIPSAKAHIEVTHLLISPSDLWGTRQTPENTSEIPTRIGILHDSSGKSHVVDPLFITFLADLSGVHRTIFWAARLGHPKNAPLLEDRTSNKSGQET